MARHRLRRTTAEQEILAELTTLYGQVDRLYAHHGCPRSTECCRFELTGREPYVTSVEVLAVAHALARRGGPLPEGRRAPPLGQSGAAEGICPLLDHDGRCVVYAARPLGCRSFWCLRASSYDSVQHRAIQAFVRELQRIAARHEPGGDAGLPLRRALAVRFSPLR